MGAHWICSHYGVWHAKMLLQKAWAPVSQELASNKGYGETLSSKVIISKIERKVAVVECLCGYSWIAMMSQLLGFRLMMCDVIELCCFCYS